MRVTGRGSEAIPWGRYRRVAQQGPESKRLSGVVEAGGGRDPYEGRDDAVLRCTIGLRDPADRGWV